MHIDEGRRRREPYEMPTSVIVGRLRAVEDNAIILGGGIRVALAPGVSVKDIPLETSVTVVAVSRDGMLLRGEPSQDA